MYYNRNRKGTPIKNWLLFGFILWTAWLGLQWFANQGELVITHRKELEAQYKLDSIIHEGNDYESKIQRLNERIEALENGLLSKQKEVTYWSNMYIKSKSKSDTTITNE